MLDDLDSRVEEWVRGIARPADVYLGSPAEMQAHAGVMLYLLEVLPKAPLRGQRRPPLALSARYLVTTWHKDVRKAHCLLGKLMFAALEQTEFEVEGTPPPVGLWSAFGLAPQPCFVLRASLVKERPEPRAKPVRSRLVVKNSWLRRLRGRVCGPGGLGLMGARVSLPGIQGSASTDAEGRFQLANVPKDVPIEVVHLITRGREIACRVSEPAEGEPLMIELTEKQLGLIEERS